MSLPSQIFIIPQYQMVAKDAASAPMAVTLVKGYLKGLIGDNGSYYVQNESQWTRWPSPDIRWRCR